MVWRLCSRVLGTSLWKKEAMNSCFCHVSSQPNCKQISHAIAQKTTQKTLLPYNRCFVSSVKNMPPFVYSTTLPSRLWNTQKTCYASSQSKRAEATSEIPQIIPAANWKNPGRVLGGLLWSTEMLSKALSIHQNITKTTGKCIQKSTTPPYKTYTRALGDPLWSIEMMHHARKIKPNHTVDTEAKALLVPTTTCNQASGKTWRNIVMRYASSKFNLIWKSTRLGKNLSGKPNEGYEKGNAEPAKANKQKVKKSANKLKTRALKIQHLSINTKSYGFARFLDIVRNYDKILDKNFPSAMKVYRLFFEGVKDFYVDLKHYLKLVRIANESSQGVRIFNRQELELYRQMPRDIFKVAPTLVLSSLPLIGYAVFPLAFMFPRQLLSSHFWNSQERCDFQILELRERRVYTKYVLTLLQERLPTTCYHEKHAELSHIIAQLSTGFQPSVEEILSVKDIFADALKLESLSIRHIMYLNQMYGMRSYTSRKALREHAILIHYMDLAIQRERGVQNMNPYAIWNCCFIRGLNPANIKLEEKIDWLEKWIHISSSIQGKHITLFMHLPLFLGHNHVNNWILDVKN